MKISQQDKAGTESEPKVPQWPQGKPLDLVQWKSLFDANGVANCKMIKQIIFRGGIDPTIRREVWKYLLGFHSWGSTNDERQNERKEKVNEYFSMKRQWKTMTPGQEQRFSAFRDLKTIVVKDVNRTDRCEQFFEGDQNPNVQMMHDILMTYCMYNFDLGYVQGMSDLLSPLLMVMENEVDTFWCFVGLMDRMWRNFELNQGDTKNQLFQIQKLMQFFDPELLSYLEKQNSGNFFFCFRWILILFKRDFPLEEIQRLWEVFWTDLPCKNYHLIFALAILERERNTFIENQLDFNDIVQHINNAANSFSLDELLGRADNVYQRLMKAATLPAEVCEILGLPSPSPPSSSSAGTSSGPVPSGSSRLQT